MTDNNKENNEHLEKNQDDNFQENNKKSNRNIIIRCFVYGLLSIFVLTFCIYINFPKINNCIQKMIPQKHNIFVKGPNMHYYHNGPAVLLDDGNVLVIGGNTKQAEIYDYKQNKFIVLDNELNYKRIGGATLTKLFDGRILIVGGNNNWDSKILTKIKRKIIEQVEIYDPITKTFSVIANMNIPRTAHTSILLEDGRVLVLGGYDANYKQVLEIEMFNPNTSKIEVVSKINDNNIQWFGFTKISNKKILLIGYEYKEGKKEIKKILYNYDSNKFETTPKIHNKKIVNSKKEIFVTNINFSQNFIYNDNLFNYIIVVEKEDDEIINIELLDCANRTKDKKYIRVLDYTLSKSDAYNAIMIGGFYHYGWGNVVTSDSEIINLFNNQISKNVATLNIERYKHIAITLKNNNILIIGGMNRQDNQVITSEIYYK